ncbi:nuclear transport factor 2 family protein [uncultured Tateyamaria sp.]|uniref:nuclear transport factor 2 family protein n=1 Tax=uncultured Tateyamaria sp. TaxID=455651 RepID=UPI00261642D2|nr:nuclear transport factor 2 family protein [uncultured Tateyamaria sp.]
MSTQTQTAAEIAAELFDHYRAQDVPAMVAMFKPEGIVEYVPFALAGPVEQVGPGSWGVLIDSFPNLSNSIHSITGDASGRKAWIDVDISGTQAKEAFGVPSKGHAYNLRHLFVLDTDENGKITHMTAFWDNVDWYRQLGKETID